MRFLIGLFLWLTFGAFVMFATKDDILARYGDTLETRVIFMIIGPPVVAGMALLCYGAEYDCSTKDGK